MPTLIIDNQTVTVAAGSNVLEAAKELGIVIPHFCYHQALGAVGACRLCAMTFVAGPVKGVQMACMVEAKDGMVVSTLDPAAVEQRRHVIEWLMMNHPHDCPVCDEGGECQLQDMTIAGEHEGRRYRGPKRTFVNQQLGPFIQQEMNRCIHCYRCLRTYRDYCGGNDFGALGSRQRVFFGRVREGRLQSPFSGNLVDVCPTGVFTDKTYRFQSRHWDLQEAPSICPHCSLGCAVIPGGRLRELQRVRSGISRSVNDCFICDRGRFGYGHANHPGRLRLPLVDGQESTWGAALDTLNRRVAAIVAEHGPGSVALLGSGRASLEAGDLLRRWAAALGSDRLAFGCNPGRDHMARQASGLGELQRSLEQIRHSDCVVLVGAEPLAEGPLLALALRQVVRRGGLVAVLDPRPLRLPLEALHLPLHPDLLPAALTALAGGPVEHFSPAEATALATIAARLAQAKRPILVGGGDLLGAAGVAQLRHTVLALATAERACGAMVLLARVNSCGAALLAGSGPDLDELLDGMLNGSIRALVCLEADPLGEHPHPGRAEAALERLELLAVLEALPTPTARRAGLLLPTTVPAESSGSVVNNEGRMLPFAAVLEPGLSVRSTGAGGHPPRAFRSDTPGDQPRPAWTVLAELLGVAPELAAVRADLERRDPRFAGLSQLQPGGEGRRISAAPLPLPPRPAPSAVKARSGIYLLPVAAEHGSDLLASYSPPWAGLTPEPYLLLHSADAAGLDLAAGDRVRLETELGHLSLALRLSTEMAVGVALLPRLRGTASEHVIPGVGAWPCRIAKEGGP